MDYGSDGMHIFTNILWNHLLNLTFPNRFHAPSDGNVKFIFVLIILNMIFNTVNAASIYLKIL